MNIKHLEYFEAVAKHGSINKAAQALYISQPHLSHIIKDLEDDFGCVLFVRNKQGVVLTAEGERYLKHARLILQEMQCISSISSKHEHIGDRLSVSMTKFSHTMECFNEVCRDKDYDNFCYTLYEGNTADVISDVESGTADVGVIHFAQEQSDAMEKLFKERKLRFIKVASLHPHICISRNHELMQRGEKITLQSLKNYGFVRYIDQYEDFIYHITTEYLQLDLNSSPKIMYVHGRSALMHMISCSNFYSIGISEFGSQLSMYNVVSIPIENCRERLFFGMVLRNGEELNATAAEFVRRVKSRYTEIERRSENQ